MSFNLEVEDSVLHPTNVVLKTKLDTKVLLSLSNLWSFFNKKCFVFETLWTKIEPVTLIHKQEKHIDTIKKERKRREEIQLKKMAQKYNVQVN